MIETIRNAWKIPELKKKIIYTIVAMLIFRIGAVIPVPFVNTVALGNYLDSHEMRNETVYRQAKSMMDGGSHEAARVLFAGLGVYGLLKQEQKKIIGETVKILK